MDDLLIHERMAIIDYDFNRTSHTWVLALKRQTSRSTIPRMECRRSAIAWVLYCSFLPRVFLVTYRAVELDTNTRERFCCANPVVFFYIELNSENQTKFVRSIVYINQAFESIKILMDAICKSTFLRVSIRMYFRMVSSKRNTRRSHLDDDNDTSKQRWRTRQANQFSYLSWSAINLQGNTRKVHDTT